MVKSFREFITEAANNIKVAKHLAVKAGFKDVIAILHQKRANHDQQVWKVSNEDNKAFGKGLKSDEVLIRLETPMSSPANGLNRSLAKINTSKGTIAFVDSNEYINGKIKFKSPLKLKYLTIAPGEEDYFNLSNIPVVTI